MRTAQRMTDIKLRNTTKTTACGVVPGLTVVVRKLQDGTYSRRFVYKVMRQGVTKTVTIGTYPQVSLSDAFKEAARLSESFANGIPEVEEEKVDGDVYTLREMIVEWYEFSERRGLWNNSLKSREELWDGYFRNHIPEELQNKPASEVTAYDFFHAFEEKWKEMVDTPERILCDVRRAYEWAMRTGKVPPMLNPAQVNGGLLGDLLPVVRLEGGHEPALPPKRMPAFFAALMKNVPTSQTARCLAFAILTAARNSTAREAVWGEIVKEDGIGHIHLIAREKMKTKKAQLPFDRKTPLSDAALRILETAPRITGDDDEFIFQNIFKGKSKPFTREAFGGLLKRLHQAQHKIDGIGWIDPEQKTPQGASRIVTMHGLSRATFNTWAKDASRYGHDDFSYELREMCLDHRTEKYKCAYDREQALGDMKRVFDQWAEFCMSEVE